MQTLTALDLHGTILRVEGIVMQIHHAGQGRRESHAVRDRTVAQQSDKLVTFSDVVQKAANRHERV
jgi:hypothetical protein